MQIAYAYYRMCAVELHAATTFNNHIGSVKALQARICGEVHPCHIIVHGVTCVAA